MTTAELIEKARKAILTDQPNLASLYMVNAYKASVRSEQLTRVTTTAVHMQRVALGFKAFEFAVADAAKSMAGMARAFVA